MRTRRSSRTVTLVPGEEALLTRLEAIGGGAQVRAGTEAGLRAVLTQTAAGLFEPEELPRFLQVQLVGPDRRVPAWSDVTGERITHLGLAHHLGGVDVDDCGTVLPTLVPVTIDYVTCVEGRRVCSSAVYDPAITTTTFQGGVHRTVMTAPDLTVTRSAFAHSLMDLHFVQVSFRLRNTSEQFHAVTLDLLIKPFDNDGITSLERFSFSRDSILMLNGCAIAFTRERSSRTVIKAYDATSGTMSEVDAAQEAISATGLMHVRLSYEHQLEPGGDTETTFFFFVDRDRAYTADGLSLLLGQSAGILEQEHRLVASQERHVAYRTGDERLNRFADNQMTHLGALESAAESAFAEGADAVALPALVQAYDRVGETETAAEVLKRYAARLPAGPALSTDGLFAYASLVASLAWHLSVTRQMQLKRQLFPIVEQFITWLSQMQTTVDPIAVSLFGPLRRSGPALHLLLGKSIEGYQDMLSARDTERLRFCDDLQLKLFKQADAAEGHASSGGHSFADMATIVMYALFGAHGTEDSVLVQSANWIMERWMQDGFVRNPFAASLGDVRLSILLAKTLLMQRQNSMYGLIQQGMKRLNASDALPDYVDLQTGLAVHGPRHSVMTAALAVELLTSLIFLERGTYLSIVPVPFPELFAGEGVDVRGLQSTFGELSVRIQHRDDKVLFSVRSDFLRGVSAIEINFPWDLRELVARKGTVKYVTGGTIVMEPADTIEGEAVVSVPGPS